MHRSSPQQQRGSLAPHRHRLRFALSAMAFLVLSFAALALAQDPLVGSFSDGRLTITLQGTGGQYSGQIELQDQTYPFTAQGTPHRIDGTFQVGGDRFPFSASLRDDTLLLESGSAGYTLARQSAARQAVPAVQRAIAAGMRLTYETAAVSHPGTNSGPDARSSGGSGIEQYEIVHVDDEMCVLTRAGYMYDPLGGGSLSPSPALSGVVVGRGGVCPDVWWPPARLEAYTPPPGASTQQVGRGPFQLPQGGPTFNALTISEELAGTRFSYAWDLDSGLLLMYTDGTGPRQVPAPGPTSSSTRTLVAVRQLNLPWTTTTALPTHIQDLQELTYRMQQTVAIASGSFPGSAQTQQAEVRLLVTERHPTFLLLRAADAPAGQGGEFILATTASTFVHPDTLARLQPGQLLDEDDVTRARLSVESVDGTAVVLLERSPTFENRATFDARTGLLFASSLQINDGSAITTMEMQLVSQR